MNTATSIGLIVLMAMGCCAVAAGSQPPGPPQDGQGQRRVPPPEAFDACNGKQEGDKATFTTPRGETLTGACHMVPARLAVMPDHPPQGAGNGRQRPPNAPQNGQQNGQQGGQPYGQPSR